MDRESKICEAFFNEDQIRKFYFSLRSNLVPKNNISTTISLFPILNVLFGFQMREWPDQNFKIDFFWSFCKHLQLLYNKTDHSDDIFSAWWSENVHFFSFPSVIVFTDLESKDVREIQVICMQLVYIYIFRLFTWNPEILMHFFPLQITS